MENEQTDPMEPKKSNNLLLIVATFFISALVVGGGVYFWQQSQINNLNKEIETLKQKQSSSSAGQTEVSKSTVKWTHQQFGDFWDIEYPEGWEVNDAGLVEGNIILQGEYNKRSYAITLFYPVNLGYNPPLDPQPENVTLAQWVEHELSFMTSDQRANLEILDKTIAGTQAKQVNNGPELVYNDGQTRKYTDNVEDLAYLWEKGDKTPRVIKAKQTAASTNADDLKDFFNLFLSKVK